MKSWDEVAPERLKFPIGGKTYVVPDIGWQQMLDIETGLSGGTVEFDGYGWQLVLGTAWDEMTADNVPAEAIARAGLASLTYFRTGRLELAEDVWEKGVDPKGLADAIAARIAPVTSNATGEAIATPSPGRSSGTSSRPTSKRTSKRTPVKPKPSRS